VWDYFSLNPEHAPMRCIAQPGDIIAVPACYYHATENVGESFSLGGQMDITVDEDFIADPDAYANQMPNSSVQLRNTAMLLEAAGDLQAALRFVRPLLKRHPMELNMAKRAIRWYSRLQQAGSALKTLLFYMRELGQLRAEGFVGEVDHAKYVSEFCLEFQTNLHLNAFAELAVNDKRGGLIPVPLLLQQVYEAAAPHHRRGHDGLALCRRQFEKLTPRLAEEWSSAAALLGGLLVVGGYVLQWLLRRRTGPQPSQQVPVMRGAKAAKRR